MTDQAQHSPLVGFNSNVRYRGHTFHIQTEDSGRSRPHVITLLFADGGHIIASRRSDYAALLQEPEWEGQVKRQMQEQHRAVLRQLASGALDEKITGLLGSLPPKSAPQSDGAVPRLRGGPTSSQRGGDLELLGLGSFVDPLLAVVREGIEPIVKAEPNGCTASKSPPPDGSPGQSQSPQVPAAPPAFRRKSPPVTDASPRPATRPAAIFGINEASLFGVEELKEESLNDVILSFISEELESND